MQHPKPRTLPEWRQAAERVTAHLLIEIGVLRIVLLHTALETRDDAAAEPRVEVQCNHARGHDRRQEGCCSRCRDPHPMQQAQMGCGTALGRPVAEACGYSRNRQRHVATETCADVLEHVPQRRRMSTCSWTCAWTYVWTHVDVDEYKYNTYRCIRKKGSADERRKYLGQRHTHDEDRHLQQRSKLQIPVRINMCVDMCMDMCMDVHRHVHRHVCPLVCLDMHAEANEESLRQRWASHPYIHLDKRW